MIDDKPMKLTNDGERLVKSWVEAGRKIGQANAELSRAKSSKAVAEKALGEWLMPPDAKVEEKYCVWFGDSLIEATMTSQYPPSFAVNLRYRGKNWDR